MVEKIKKYLDQPVDERDYDEGLLLLSKSTKNRMLLQRLGRKPWPEKLHYELRKILDRKIAKIENYKNQIANKAAATRAANKAKKEEKRLAKEAAAASKQGTGDDDPPIECLPFEFTEESKPGRVRVVKEDQKINFDDLPGELKLKWTQNAEMYKEARSLHEKLKLMKDATDDDRKPIITRLGQLSGSVRSNWDAIDNYDPNANPKETVKVDIDHKRISANRKYISSNLKKLEKDPDNKNLYAKIQERITELLGANISFSADQLKRLEELKFDLQSRGE